MYWSLHYLHIMGIIYDLWIREFPICLVPFLYKVKQLSFVIMKCNNSNFYKKILTDNYDCCKIIYVLFLSFYISVNIMLLFWHLIFLDLLFVSWFKIFLIYFSFYFYWHRMNDFKGKSFWEINYLIMICQ